MLEKLVAVIKFYFLKYLKKNIVISSSKPSFIGYAAIVQTIGKYGSIKINGRVRLERFTELESKGKLVLGNNVVINKFSRIITRENITIGDNVVIARFVSILDHDHAYTIEDGMMKLNGYSSKPITIGNNVWIGDKVSITKGVTIGDNVIIGANSVVTKNIPSNCIVAGVPAKPIKSL